MRLLWQFIIRHLLQQPLRPVITTLGIALGIALVIAIQLTNESSVKGFESAVETIAGKSSLEITGTGLGIEESSLRGLVWLTKYGTVGPVIEGDARLHIESHPRETLHILGVDILRDRSLREYRLRGEEQKELSPTSLLQLLLNPDSIIITEKLARRLDIKAGSNIRLTFGDHTSEFKVQGLLLDDGAAKALDGSFAIMDIAAAQLAFNRLGRIDRLDLRPSQEGNISAVESEIARQLPPGLKVQRPARRGAQAEKMLEAFHFNLSALSYLALIVGLFLVYNTISISVIARRTEIGTLRALGVTRTNILLLFLSEAAILSFIGSALGIGIGRVLSVGAIKLTSTTVQSLYIATAASPSSLSAKHFLLAFAIGLPLSMLAALLPALEAYNVSPISAIKGSDRLESRFRLRKLWLIGPLLLLLAAYLFCIPGPVKGLPLFAYGAALLIVAAASLFIPAFLYLAARASRSLLARSRVELLLASANLGGAIPRLSISVGALAISLAMMVAVATMIGSFRETVTYWIGQTLRADLYLRPATRTNVSVDATLSPEVLTAVRQLPDVAAVDRFRNFDVPFEDGLVTVGAGDFSVLIAHGHLQFKDPSNEADALELMRSSIGRNKLVVSESFAIRRNRKRGDIVSLDTPQGKQDFEIAAVYYDYSSDRGVLVMDIGTLEKYWGPQPPTSLSVYLRDGADSDAARGRILEKLGEKFQVLILTNSSIRREVLRIFDSTFAITYALEVIAILVAMLGVSATLFTLILERSREIGLLRLIGTARGQIRLMVVTEALFIGVISQIAGVVTGLLLSLVLIYVINVQSFGWTIQFHLPWLFILQSSGIVIVATALAGLFPARRVMRQANLVATDE